MSVVQEEFAAILREAFIKVASKAWEARDLGITEDDMLVGVAEAIEPLVQSIVRKTRGTA